MNDDLIFYSDSCPATYGRIDLTATICFYDGDARKA